MQPWFTASQLDLRSCTHNLTFVAILQNEPLFLRTYTDADGEEEEEDATHRLHNIVHSSLDVVGDKKGRLCKRMPAR